MNPWALSNALASLATLWLKALGFINTVDPSVLVSNPIMCEVLKLVKAHITAYNKGESTAAILDAKKVF